MAKDGLGGFPVDRLTDCPKCRGTGIIPTPSLEDCQHKVVCDCGAYPVATVKPGAVYAGNHHPLTWLVYDGKVAEVDVGIADDVLALWKAGIETWVSCQGDERLGRYIGIRDPSRADEARALLPWAVFEEPGAFGGDYVFRNRVEGS